MPTDFSPEILDQILSGYSKPEDLTSDDGISDGSRKP